MKNTFLKSIKYVMVAIIMILALGLNDDELLAATANVAVSSTSVEEGSEFDISVTISSADKMAAYNILLTYDANLLEYVSGADGGGNGAVKLLNELFEDTSVTKTLKFKAKKAGSVAINVDTTGSSILDMAVEDCEIAITNGTVTVNPKVTSSSNNNLASLEVVGVREDGSTVAYKITQRNTNVVGFNKDELKYMAYVANDIVKFAVTAVPEDNTATVNVAGVDLAEGGANTTTITVTAQNGEVKTYTINTYRVPSEGEEESETPSETEGESESESETTTATPVDKEVTIGNDIYIVTNITEDTVIPEGFSRFDYAYEGQNYVAAKGEAKKLTIMQLVKKGTEEKALYVYDETDKVFYKFVNIQIINKMYTVTEKPEEVKIPDDFETTLVNIEGEMLNVWANKNEEGIYLFYGMNWNGEEGLYLYDSKEKTAMRYLALTSSEVSNTVTPQPDNNDNTTANNENSAKNSDGSQKNIVIIVEAAIILVLIIVIIIMIIKAKNPDLDDDDDELDDDMADDKNKDDDILTDEELAEMDADAAMDEAYEENEKAEESEILANAINYLMEKEAAAASEEAVVAEETVTEEAVEEEAVTEEIAVEEEKVTEDIDDREEEAITEELSIQEEIVDDETETEEAITEELATQEVPEEPTVNKSLSIEEMLEDSSTSLNDDELDFVLDKLLGDE